MVPGGLPRAAMDEVLPWRDHARGQMGDAVGHTDENSSGWFTGYPAVHGGSRRFTAVHGGLPAVYEIYGGLAAVYRRFLSL